MPDNTNRQNPAGYWLDKFNNVIYEPIPYLIRLKIKKALLKTGHGKDLIINHSTNVIEFKMHVFGDAHLNNLFTVISDNKLNWRIWPYSEKLVRLEIRGSVIKKK